MKYHKPDMSPSVASQSSQTPDVVLCRCSIVCVIPMPTKPLYTQFCPFPTLLRRAPCRSILINFLSFFLLLVVRFDLSLMSFYSRRAFYVCAICCNRCALDVLCLFHSSLLFTIFKFIPPVRHRFSSSDAPSL
jgi:hypothetical protein